MWDSVRLDADVIRKSLLLAAVSTVVAAALVCAAYLTIHGQDDRFYDAMAFALVIPFFCATPIGLVVHSQSKDLALLNDELQHANAAASELNQKLAHEASHDAMTGFLNRKYFLAELARRCDEDAHDCLLLIDADRFKKINDIFGHHAGDQALVRIAQLIDDQLGSNDVIGRVGGEEFAVLLKDRTIGDAFITAETIRQAVYGADFETDEGEQCALSVSIGINRLGKAEKQYPLRKVDLALYQAKNLGRNRTVKFEPAMDVPSAERFGEVTNLAAG